MVLALPRLSATTDEVVHLPAGYTYWTTRDFRLNPEHPPLAKLFAAIPLLALKPRLDLSWPEWNSPQQYIFGYGFLYTNDADRLLFGAAADDLARDALRLHRISLGVQNVWRRVRVFALGLFAFSPNVLAHGMLVTTDVPVGAFMILALYLFWTTIERPSLMRNVAIGLATGAAMSSRFPERSCQSF